MIHTVTLNPAMDKTVRIPGFLPNAVNRVQSLQTDPGGKGINVSRWVRMLGGRTRALGILGGETGQFIARTLEEEGVASDFVWTQADTRINLKIIDPEAGTHTDVNEPGALVTDETLCAVYDRLRQGLSPGDIVVLCGKSPPGTPDGLFADWTRLLKEAGARVYIDAEGEALRLAVKAAPTLIKPNRMELEGCIGRRLDGISGVADVLCTLSASGIPRVVASLGGEGAVFWLDGVMLHAEALSVPVGSTVGAGDAMVAALAFAQEAELAPMETARLSMAAGAASVMQPGTQVAAKKIVDVLEKQVICEKIGV